MKSRFENISTIDVARTAAIAAFAVSAVFATAAPASAEGVTANRGACISNLAQTAVDMVANQAPGQTNNGPMTIVNADIHVAAAFDGGVACAR